MARCLCWRFGYFLCRRAVYVVSKTCIRIDRWQDWALEKAWETGVVLMC